MRVMRLCAAVYLLILMNCAFQTTSDLWHLAFNGQLYGQTKERKKVLCDLPPAPGSQVGCGTHWPQAVASPTTCCWCVVVWLPISWWKMEPSPFLSSVNLCEVEPGISFESHYQLHVSSVAFSLEIVTSAADSWIEGIGLCSSISLFLFFLLLCSFPWSCDWVQLSSAAEYLAKLSMLAIVSLRKGRRRILCPFSLCVVQLMNSISEEFHFLSMQDFSQKINAEYIWSAKAIFCF